MYQLNTSNLIKISKLAFQLRFCSTQICSRISNIQINQSNKMTVRNLSVTPMNCLQEKPKYDETVGKKEEILHGKLEPEEGTIKKFVKDYGKLGLIVYISVSLSTLLILYGLISFSIDLSYIINLFGMSAKLTDQLSKYEKGSAFVIAYCISKLLVPMKLIVSGVIMALIKRPR